MSGEEVQHRYVDTRAPSQATPVWLHNSYDERSGTMSALYASSPLYSDDRLYDWVPMRRQVRRRPVGEWSEWEDAE